MYTYLDQNKTFIIALPNRPYNYRNKFKVTTYLIIIYTLLDMDIILAFPLNHPSLLLISCYLFFINKSHAKILTNISVYIWSRYVLHYSVKFGVEF